MKPLFALAWFAAAIAFLLIITLPVSVGTQAILSVATLIALLLLRPFGRFRVMRVLVIAIASILILRYVFWRTTSTLPPIDEPLNFIPGIMLYGGEMFSVVLLAISLFLVMRPLPARPERRLGPDEPRPSVDVFVPTYNEPAEMLVHTLIAARDMTYDGVKTVWLLDDGGTDAKVGHTDPEIAEAARARRAELGEMCKALGVCYLTRADNKMAKAGNLNNGLEHSAADVVVVLDADHVPTRDFLMQTVGYFNDDPDLFLVQTPHFFINPDPIERNLGTFEHMPGENEMFYGIIQRGLDKWDASFFCGSAALLRRAALEQVGGFSGSSITEDCETALGLHARGWSSIYVDRPMIAGLQPETFSNFIGQRSRWAQGMMQILLLRRPFFTRGLSFGQRMGYLSSTLFWLFPLARMTFVIAPFFFLLFGLQIFNASGAEFLAYTGGFIAANFLLQNFLYGRFRKPLFSELYEYAQAPYLSRAVLSAIVNPTAPSFRVTSKDEDTTTARMSEISRPLVVLFGLTVVGIAVTAWRLWVEPYNSDVLFIVGFWNIFNFLILGAALGAIAERGMEGTERRLRIDRPAHLEIGTQTRDILIEDVTTSAATVSMPRARLAEIADPDADQLAGRIVFDGHGDTARRFVPVAMKARAHDEGLTRLTLDYTPTSPEDYAAIGDLVYSDDTRWSDFREYRRGNRGVVAGLVGFVDLALRQIDRAMRYARHADREQAGRVEILEMRGRG